MNSYKGIKYYQNYINIKLKTFAASYFVHVLICFSSIVKQVLFAYVNHAQICSWNQPVLSNEGKVYCSRKQRELLIKLKLTTDRHPPITSQTRYPLRHTAP